MDLRRFSPFVLLLVLSLPSASRAQSGATPLSSRGKVVEELHDELEKVVHDTFTTSGLTNVQPKVEWCFGIAADAEDATAHLDRVREDLRNYAQATVEVLSDLRAEGNAAAVAIKDVVFFTYQRWNPRHWWRMAFGSNLELTDLAWEEMEGPKQLGESLKRDVKLVGQCLADMVSTPAYPTMWMIRLGFVGGKRYGTALYLYLPRDGEDEENGFRYLERQETYSDDLRQFIEEAAEDR